MDTQQTKNTQSGKEEGLFTPKNIINKRQDIPTKQDKFQDKIQSYQNYDLRENIVQNQSTVKKKTKQRDNYFLANIKNQLATLKTEVDRIINNEGQVEVTNKHKNISRPISDNHSDSSGDSYESRALWRQRLFKTQANDIDNSSTLTDRRMKLFEQENETLKNQIKKIKSKHKQHKEQAENIMMILHQRLAEAQQTIASHDQQLLTYKKQVQRQMSSIKKMLQNAQNRSLKQSDLSTRPSSSILQDQNISLRSSLIQLKSNLLQKQKVLSGQSLKLQSLTKQNQRLKQQLQHFHHHFQSSLSNVLFKCGQSQIHLQYSKSRIDHDQSKALFELQDDMMLMKQSNAQRKEKEIQQSKQDIISELNTFKIRNEEFKKQITSLQEHNRQLQKHIYTIQNEKTILMNQITLLENQIQNIKCKNNTQTVKFVEEKIFRLIDQHSKEVTNIRNQLNRNNSESNLLLVEDLKEQLKEKLEEVEKVRQAIRGVHSELVLSRSTIETMSAKFAQEKKYLIAQLEQTRHNLRQQILCLEKANNNLFQIIKEYELNPEKRRDKKYQQQRFKSTNIPTNGSSQNIQRKVEYTYEYSGGNNTVTRRVSEQKTSKTVRQESSYVRK